MASEKIFISYRREDTSGESGRLKDRLEQVFGKENIFYDVETLEAGLNFDESIAKALNESKVLLAMIGPHWLKVTDSNGVKRIQKDEDWVRKEIGEALKRDLRVIPILVNGAEMPDSQELPEDLKELTMRHAQELTSSRWNYDVGELTKVLEKIIKVRPIPGPQPNPRPPIPPVPKPKSWWAKNYLWALGGIVGFLLLIGMCVPEDDYNGSTGNYSGENIGGDTKSTLLYDEGVPALVGNWFLYLNGEKASTLVFVQNGSIVEFEEFNTFNDHIGSGAGQIDKQNLEMSYYNSFVDMEGSISVSTQNSGQTWVGSIYFPSTGGSGQIEIRKN